VRANNPFESPDATRAALQASAVEGIGTGKLTVHQARQMLGIPSRYEMNGFLKAPGVLFAITFEDVVADGNTANVFSK